MSPTLKLVVVLPLLPAAALAQDSYEQVYAAVQGMAPRADRAAAVRDLVLRRDVAEFRLAEGTLYLLTPVAGRTVGAVFVGQGSVSFDPPLPVERTYMRRVLKDSMLDAPIAATVLLFTDSTLAQLERSLTFAQSAPDPAAAARVKDALEFLVDGRARSVDPTFLTGLLNADASGFFGGYVKRLRGEDLMIQVDPYQIEEIFLLRRGKLREQRVETVCQFDRAEDRQRGIAAADQHPEPLQLAAYRLDASIQGDLDFSAAATVRLRARHDSVRWVPFTLYEELKVDSVVRPAGAAAKATFFRDDHGPALWVRFDPPLRPGVADSVLVAYHGDLIDHGSLMQRRGTFGANDRWAFIKSTWSWYPRYSEWQAADMDLTFHTPRNYRFASIGRQVESRVEGNVATTRWVSEAPTEQASFNIGEFEELKINDPRIPPVTVQVNTEAHARLNEVLLGQRNPGREVAADVANSLAFFSRVFGPPLFRQYYATEIPYAHGQAFPGMIHLSWWTFQTIRDTGWEEIFRAHEMAHQWWGIGVEPADYRDTWLSEGFAMFAGLWYMQLVLRDNDKYFKQLREWRAAIRRARDDAPPVSLGARALQHDPEHYDLIVYRKGAWVLHMLRNLMLDVRTMKEDAFAETMRDFYETFRGHQASTQDFQSVVERHLNQPMDWFFREWVDGTDIPTYVLSHQVEQTADGQYRVRLRLRQEDVPETFRMPVPVAIETADGNRTLVRVDARGPVTEAEVLLPSKPVLFEMNPLESVLAEVKEEGWTSKPEDSHPRPQLD